VAITPRPQVNWEPQIRPSPVMRQTRWITEIRTLQAFTFQLFWF
jgi:hypothetical protein